jgi:hypothetical protein
MKKILLLSLTVFSLMLSSCSKETMITNELDGEIWKVTNISTVNGSNTNTNASPSITYTFDKEGGKGTKMDGSNTYNITWSVADETLTVVVEGWATYTYTIKKSGYSKQTWERTYSFIGTNVETLSLEKQ